MTQPAHQPGTVLEHALAYLGLGWGLCSIAAGTKGPTTSGWNAPGMVLSSPGAVAAEFAARPANGLGLIHSASGTCAIDVDHLGGWAIILTEFGIDAAELFGTAPRIVGRGDRDKAIFRVPAGLELTRRALAWPAPPGAQLDAKTGKPKPITVFELRGGPVQDVLPPTIHPDTQQPYRWRDGTEPFGRDIPMIPDQLLAIWTAWDSFLPQLKRLCPWATPEDCTPRPAPRPRAVGTEHGNVIGQFNQAHDLRAILEANGYAKRGKRYLAPTSSTGLAGVVVFEDGTHCYSHHGSDPLADGHAHDAFDLFCLFDHGGDAPRAVRAAAELMHIEALPDLPIVNAQGIMDAARARKAAPAAVRRQAPDDAVPGELTQIPGVLGELVDFMVDSAIKPQRMLSVAASLAFGAVCMAQRYASLTGLRTNPYIIAVAPSTAGKEHARRVVKNGLIAAGLKDRIGGEDIKSGSGVFAALHRSPAVLFQLDEFGLFLQSVTNERAGNFQADIMKQLMVMRTSANTVVMGPEYSRATQGERQDVEYPNVVVHGTTTDDSFWPALSSRHVLNGFLNRHIVIHAEGPGIRQTPKRGDADYPASVTEWATCIARPELIAGANLVGYSPAAPRRIGESQGASAALRAFEALTDAEAEALAGTGLASLWGRAAAQAIELALIVAGSRSAAHPVIDETAARWAIAFTDYWTRRLVRDCSMRMVDGAFAGQCDAVLRVLRRGDTRDRSYTRREIAKLWWGWRSLKPHEQDAVMDALVRNGDAVKGKRQGARGPASEAWLAREFAPAELAPGDDQGEAA